MFQTHNKFDIDFHFNKGMPFRKDDDSDFYTFFTDAYLKNDVQKIKEFYNEWREQKRAHEGRLEKLARLVSAINGTSWVFEFFKPLHEGEDGYHLVTDDNLK